MEGSTWKGFNSMDCLSRNTPHNPPKLPQNRAKNRYGKRDDRQIKGKAF